MFNSSRYLRYAGLGALAALTCGSLYLVVLLYAVDETLLAATLLVITALAAWIYSSSKTLALKYLFPGIAAAMVFVIAPMIYTVAGGFTNYSSQNLLDFERVRKQHREEVYRAEDAIAHTFSLHPDGHQFRIGLHDPDTDTIVYVSEPLALVAAKALRVPMIDARAYKGVINDALPLTEVIARQSPLKALILQLPQEGEVRMTSLREFAAIAPLYSENKDGSFTNSQTGQTMRANMRTGFYETENGERITPGFKVFVGWENYRRIFTDPKFSEPFVRIFLWTVAFAGLTVFFAAALGMLLAVLLSWDSLRFRSVYRFLLFLPYAVPGFISILIFRGLFNQNLGEINLILQALFGIKPAWFSDPLLAKTMILIVNTWLGFPYMMIVCMGLIKAIPADLYEASAVAGAGPLTNFFRITLPLTLKPLTPLLISSFAFNFNNLVLITLLTGGRPDYLDISVPAGTTDILVSYTYRIAFQDSGQQFALASAISTVIFFIVAGITLLQMRFTRIASEERR